MKPTTFCILPWIHLSTKPSGTLRLCCNSRGAGVVDKNNKRIKFHRFDLADWWNGSYMKEVRQKMLSGKKLEECRDCYKDELRGRASKRIKENTRWAELLGYDQIEKFIAEADSSGESNRRPVYYDLRFGNLCNLKCRSCNSGCSDKIHLENGKLKDAGHVLTDFMETADAGARYIGNWPNEKSVWSQLRAASSEIKELYMAGGEPTLIKKNWEFLQYCEEAGWAKNIKIRLNTNATHITPQQIELLGKFREVLVGVSIDGIGSVNDYIRFGSRWNNVERNINSYLNGPQSIRVIISPTLMIYNAFRIQEIIDWFASIKAQFPRTGISFGILRKPEYLSIALLPAETRAEIARELAAREASLQPEIDLLTNFLLRCDLLPDSSRQRFWAYTDMLDSFRSQKLKEVLPEIPIKLQRAQSPERSPSQIGPP